MILVIMRHGQAVEYREPDHTRALTDFGVKQCEQAGVWLKQRLPDFAHLNEEYSNAIDIALVSPYLRTQQSCRALGKGIAIKQQITFDAITPMGNALHTADIIHGYATDSPAPNSMLIVTHMPLVSLLADKICAGFNAKIFDTADTLIIDYNIETGRGDELAYYHG